MNGSEKKHVIIVTTELVLARRAQNITFICPLFYIYQYNQNQMYAVNFSYFPASVYFITCVRFLVLLFLRIELDIGPTVLPGIYETDNMLTLGCARCILFESCITGIKNRCNSRWH